MGGAILHGVISAGIEVAGGIRVTNRSVEKAAELASLDGVESIALAERPDGNSEAASGAGVVIVGVKPSMVEALLAEVAPALSEDAIVVSLAGGACRSRA